MITQADIEKGVLRGFCCEICLCDISGGSVLTQFCFKCTSIRTAELSRKRAADYTAYKRAAPHKVKAALMRGELAPVTSFDCVDCGKPATCYDHRDYAKPLDVDPVCSSCNKLRGSAKNTWIKGREPKKKRRVASITNIVKIFDSLDDSEKNEVLFKLEKRRPDIADAINQGEYDDEN